MSSRALYPRPRARPNDGSMSPRSSDGDGSPRGSHGDVSPKVSFYDGDESPRSITAACMPWSTQFAPTPLALPPAFSSPGVVQEEEGGVHESGRTEASDEESEEWESQWDRAWWEERPWPVPYASGALTCDEHVDFVAMCERKRRSSRELAGDLEDLSRAELVHPLTYFLALSAALLLLAAVMPLTFIVHPPTPPVKPKAALFQPLMMMHYEFDPDMFDNFWFPLFV